MDLNFGPISEKVVLNLVEKIDMYKSSFYCWDKCKICKGLSNLV